MDCGPPVPLSEEFSRQEYWSELPCPPPEDLPNPEIERSSPVSPALLADSLSWATRGALSWPNHVPKAPPTNTITLGRLQHMNWGEGREWNTSIPSIAHTKKVSPRGREDQIYSLLEKTPPTARLAPEVGLFSRYSFWGNTTRNQCYVNSDQTSHSPHQGFLTTSKQKWQRTTFSTFSEVNSLFWLFWDHFQCNLKILTFATWEKRSSVISLSPGTNI